MPTEIFERIRKELLQELLQKEEEVEEEFDYEDYEDMYSSDEEREVEDFDIEEDPYRYLDY